MKLTQASFNAAISHNISVFKHDLQNKTISFGKYYFVSQDQKNLIHLKTINMNVFGRLFDILAACSTGCIPIFSTIGTDAITMAKGKIHRFELKTTKISKQDFTTTKKGRVIYKTDKKIKTSFESVVKAAFSNINDGTIEQRKNRNTLFVIFDADGWFLIQAFKMDKKKVLDILEHNQLTGKKKNSSRRHISLRQFQTHGNIMKTSIDSFGIDGWKDSIKIFEKAKNNKIKPIKRKAA